MSENFEIDYAFLAATNFSAAGLADDSHSHSLTNIESSSLLLFEGDTAPAAAAVAGSSDEILKFNSVILNQDDDDDDNGHSSSAGQQQQLGVDVVQQAAESLLMDLVDDCMFAVVFQVHRAAKLGYLFLCPPAGGRSEKEPYYSDQDVLGFYSNCNEPPKTSGGKYGQSSSANNALLKYECACPNCGRTIAATRFAPHLEKCMGMGRSSSRLATRRIANYAGDELDQLIEATGIIYPKTPAATAEPPTSYAAAASTSMLNSYDQYFKAPPAPAAKKRRIQPLTKSATTILPSVQAQQQSTQKPTTSLSMLHAHSTATTATTTTGGMGASTNAAYLMDNYNASSQQMLKQPAPLYAPSSSTNN